MSNEELLKVCKRYKVLFPNETQPTMAKIKLLKSITDFSVESKYNLLYIKELGEHYEIMGGYCLAKKSNGMRFNIKVFAEVRDLVRRLDKPLVISGLNKAYHRVTHDIGDGMRSF